MEAAAQWELIMQGQAQRCRHVCVVRESFLGNAERLYYCNNRVSASMGRAKTTERSVYSVTLSLLIQLIYYT